MVVILVTFGIVAWVVVLFVVQILAIFALTEPDESWRQRP